MDVGRFLLRERTWKSFQVKDYFESCHKKRNKKGPIKSGVNRNLQ
jgi:hypothetical protein